MGAVDRSSRDAVLSDEIRVLHVDDEPGFAAMAAEFVEREDGRIETVTATSADEALDRFVDGAFDCIVSDYDMPGMNGLAFLEAVRERDETLPFILFTGKGSEEIASEAISAGVTDYLEKRSGTDQYAILTNRIVNAVESAQIHRQQQRQLDAIESAQEGISFLDDDGTFMYVNQSFADLYGYEPEEMVGESWELVYPEGELEFVHEEIIPTLRATGEWQGETTGLRADGSTFIEDHTLSTADSGKFICIVRDVTDRKTRQRELERYETIIEASGDPVYTLDDAGRFTAVNEALVEMVGYDESELLGEHVSLIMKEADVTQGDHLVASLLSSPETSKTRFEMDVVTSQGETVPCENHVALLPFEAEFRGTVGVLRDITERKDRERDLRRYERLVGAMGDAVFVVDTDGRLVELNERMEEVTGYDRSELLGKHVSTYLSDEDVERGERMIRELVDSDDLSVVTYEQAIHRADGTTVRGEVRQTLLRDDEGEEIRGTVGTLRDITDQKRRERDLERYRAYTDDLLDAIDDLFFVHDAAGNLQRWNERVAEVTGYSDAEIGTMNGIDFVPEAHRERTAERIEDVFETGAARLEAPLLTKSGATIPYEFVANRVEHPDGSPRLVGIGRDITKRHERERELERESERYRKLFENVNDAVAWVEHEGAQPIVREVNPVFEALFAAPGEDVVGRPLDDVVAAPDRRDEAEDLSRRVATGTHMSGELERDTVEGPRTFQWQAIPLENPETDDVDHGYAVYRDISELRRRERELERQNERLEEFASVVSHDIRNPLNLAVSHLELAREECESTHLERVERAHERIETLIEDLLTLAREGASVEDAAAVALDELVAACWRDVETGDLSLAVETGQTIRADASRLRQLLANLFRNALEHGGPGVTVTVGSLPDADGYYVADDGPGIPGDVRDRVFDSGYSTADEGTGFGLAIAKKIAAAHGWTIRATESEDGGARFEITGVEVES